MGTNRSEFRTWAWYKIHKNTDLLSFLFNLLFIIALREFFNVDQEKHIVHMLVIAAIMIYNKPNQ